MDLRKKRVRSRQHTIPRFSGHARVCAPQERCPHVSAQLRGGEQRQQRISATEEYSRFYQLKQNAMNEDKPISLELFGCFHGMSRTALHRFQDSLQAGVTVLTWLFTIIGLSDVNWYAR